MNIYTFAKLQLFYRTPAYLFTHDKGLLRVFIHLMVFDCKVMIVYYSAQDNGTFDGHYAIKIF